MSQAQDLKVVDCRDEISAVLAAKDEEELGMVRKSAGCVQSVMRNHFVPQLEAIIDMDEAKSQREVCSELEEGIESGQVLRGLGELQASDVDELDLVYASLQSTGPFELKPDVEPTDD